MANKVTLELGHQLCSLGSMILPQHQDHSGRELCPQFPMIWCTVRLDLHSSDSAEKKRSIFRWLSASLKNKYGLSGLWIINTLQSDSTWYIHCLTLNVRGPSYLGLTRSVSWLLMPWLLASLGHQQQWYWICEISKSRSYTRKDFNYLWHVSMEEWHKM